MSKDRKPTQIPVMDEDQSKNFWDKIDKRPGFGPNGDCWEWTAYKSDKGYGRFSVNKRLHYSHRLSYVQANGQIANDLCVLHKCDNPQCCNPEHLFAGNKADNMRDCSAKGRMVAQVSPERMSRGDDHYCRKNPERVLRGEKQGLSKLKDHQVLEIRRRYGQPGETQVALGEEFGVSHTVISNVVNRKTWRHL